MRGVPLYAVVTRARQASEEAGVAEDATLRVLVVAAFFNFDSSCRLFQL